MELRCEAKDGPVWRVRLEPGDAPAVMLDPRGVTAFEQLLDDRFSLSKHTDITKWQAHVVRRPTIMDQ